jgi:hypothetical protein
MASVVNANTITVGAGSTTNIWGITGSGTGPSRVIVRTASTGVLVGGSDLINLGYGFELLPNKEYTFDLRPRDTSFPTSGDEGSLNVKNTNGSSVTVSYIALPLA